ncbi:hypothetical protein ACFVHQ_14900 [Actinomycetes bacterium NPDC127524]
MKLNPMILITVIILGIIVGLNINKETVPSASSENQASTKNISLINKKEITSALKNKNQIPKYNYKIVHKIVKRVDGGASYYILINPVNVKNDHFKNIVKYIVKDLVHKNGGKISVEIYDNSRALDLHYKLYGDMSLERVLNKNEYIFVGNHHVAGFSGELKFGLFYNSLSYYSMANAQDNPQVGKYAEIVEFNP